MSVRSVTDSAGRLWQVWEVVPGSARTAGPVTGRMPNVWGGASSVSSVPAAPAPPSDGWLVFMHDDERRRLAPIPAGWGDLDDAELLRLLPRARR